MSFEKSVGLIGCGAWGKNLARNFYELGALHTLCDQNLLLLTQYKEKWKEIAITTSTSELLKNPAIKRIVIAAPAIQHYALAKASLLAGKDTYVEKPITLSSREAEELCHIAKERGLILMCGHLLHYHPIVEKIKELVQRGEIGKIHYITSNRLNLGAYRTEENALWNFAPHDVSVILALAGNQLPELVHAQGGAYITPGIDDLNLLSLSFKSGLKAHIFVSWINPFKEQKLTIVGSEGLLVFDDTKPWGEKLSHTKNHLEWREGRPVATSSAPLLIDPPQKEPLKEECIHFLNCCETRKTPLTDGQEALRVTRVLEAAETSIKMGGAGTTLSSAFIHPTAVIDSGATVGEGTAIWHFSHISSGARIGNNCRIGQNVYVAPEVTVGDNVKIQNNVSLYRGLHVEEDVFIGPSAVFTNILNPRSSIPRRDQYLTTTLRKGATIGANATILPGIEVGAHAFIAAGAVLTESAKPHSLMIGAPARPRGWMSELGHKLDLPLFAPHGETLTALCPESGRCYTLIGETLTADALAPR